MGKRLVVLTIIWILAVAGFAQELLSPIGKLELDDGDTLVFLGDSITHQCLYTQYVEDYYCTRYPNSRVHFHNAGVSGDKAADALVRFDEDVATFKPKYVTILLGMNDGSYTRFEQSIFDTYEQRMTSLLDRIQSIGAKAILMGPTMFDSRAEQMKKNWMEANRERNRYYNPVLGFYGAWLREEALARGLGYVDMYSPLNRLTLLQRATDPKFTLIQDAVHPGPAGHLVMAFALLSDMNASESVSSIHVTREGRREWTASCQGGRVENLQSEDNLSFTFIAECLPWVVPAEAREGYKLTKAGTSLSREFLRVSGLRRGTYELRIDGNTLGTFTYLELAAGIELQENEKTPQHQQALHVAMLNKERNDKAVRPLRDLWLQMKVKRREIAESKPDEFRAWRAEFEDKAATLRALTKDYEDKIYQANKPQPRKYEILRADG